MAIVKCRECSKDVSTEAKTCPHCGVDKPGRQPTRWVRGTLIILGIVVILVAIATHQSPSSTPTRSTTSTTAPKPGAVAASGGASSASSPPAQATPKVPAPASNWIYTTSLDAMTGKNAHLATDISDTTLSFGFPYNGAQSPMLTFRNHPRYGFDAMLRIEKGQFMCDDMDGCRVLVRIDQGKPVVYHATGPSDNSTTVLFLSNARGLYRKLLHAKTVHIAATFYQEGTQVMDFKVSGLKASRLH